ncbi:MATE family efflux transporter [Butyrivibrio sp. CB08]|uniref:MATE family efflux transporter n=1 Tax=Butyrivibrio sp. CB08 TaxID=2364879 RepID=UPI001FA9C944|nr:MATE family efflux transporter [Butyrivibrio sp. CB08]
MAKENRMGTQPVKQLIISMSLPMMISMLVQALYNVVDSIFVARVGEGALTAVTLAFPMQNLMIAVGSGTGVGINALLSRSLGEKRFDRSDSAANNGIFLTFLSFILFLIIGLFFSEPFIRSQISDPQIIAYGATYLRIVSCLSFGIFFQMTFERLLQSTGKTIYSMISQGTGAIINIIFDPLLIFGIGPFPELGVAGAAYATVLGQLVGSSIGLFCNLKFNNEINISIKKILKPEASTIGEIYFVGVPSMLMMSIGSAMTYLMNLILGTFSATATAVFGVYFKLQSFFFMPVFGLNNGLIPVLAYNYGAKRKDRIKEALKFAIVLAVSIMVIGCVTFLAIPELLLSFFKASDDMLAIGVPALRTICLSFPLAGVCIAMGSIFQAFSKSFYSLIVSIGRQLVVLIPVAWLFSKTGNVNMVWWAFPIAELMSLALSSYFFRKLYREKVATM